MKYINNPLIRIGAASLLATTLTVSLVGCGAKEGSTSAAKTMTETVASETVASDSGSVVSTASVTTGGAIDTTDLFTERDLTQTADLTNAAYVTVNSGEDIQITQEGVYVISGEATDATIVVEADDTAKVQLVLSGVSITNADFPAIYVKSADKVFVTTAEGTTNNLTVSGSFVADGDTNTDAVIFSKDDLTLNGLGALVINSSANGVTSKDDLKVTGGSYAIVSAADALEANDSIRISDGSFTITSSKDGLHAENGDDDSKGYVYICGGSFTIEAASDGIQATTVLQIDNGSFAITAGEGLEATYVQVNGGSVDISASDDGINASTKSTSVGTPTIEITGGEATVNMGAGDTDALDVNGNLVISGGTINLNGQFAFDYDGSASFTGGTVYVNGEQVTEISNSMMMGGGGRGGFGGGMGQRGGGMTPPSGDMGQPSGNMGQMSSETSLSM